MIDRIESYDRIQEVLRENSVVVGASTSFIGNTTTELLGLMTKAASIYPSVKFFIIEDNPEVSEQLQATVNPTIFYWKTEQLLNKQEGLPQGFDDFCNNLGKLFE